MSNGLSFPRQERDVSEATVILKAWGTWEFVSASSQGYLSPTHPGIFTSLTAGSNQRELFILSEHITQNQPPGQDSITARVSESRLLMWPALSGLKFLSTLIFLKSYLGRTNT